VSYSASVIVPERVDGRSRKERASEELMFLRLARMPACELKDAAGTESWSCDASSAGDGH
jgi:hypothetical protein